MANKAEIKVQGPHQTIKIEAARSTMVSTFLADLQALAEQNSADKEKLDA